MESDLLLFLLVLELFVPLQKLEDGLRSDSLQLHLHGIASLGLVVVPLNLLVEELAAQVHFDAIVIEV